jgi:hypothetical protein
LRSLTYFDSIISRRFLSGNFIAALPVPCTAAIFVVVHIGANPSVLPYLLGHTGQLPAAFAREKIAKVSCR